MRAWRPSPRHHSASSPSSGGDGRGSAAAARGPGGRRGERPARRCCRRGRPGRARAPRRWRSPRPARPSRSGARARAGRPARRFATPPGRARARPARARCDGAAPAPAAHSNGGLAASLRVVASRPAGVGLSRWIAADRLAVALRVDAPRRPSARPTRPTGCRARRAARPRPAAWPRPGRAAARTAPGSASSRSSGSSRCARSKSSIACRHSRRAHAGIGHDRDRTRRVAIAWLRASTHEPGDQQDRDERDQHARDERRARAPAVCSDSAATRPVCRRAACGTPRRLVRALALPPMPRLAVLVSAAALLVGPTVLAFFAGGYFDGPRAIAAAIAWALVLLLAVAGPLPLPASRAGRVALAAPRRPGRLERRVARLGAAARPGARRRRSGCCSTSPCCSPRVAVLRDPRAARAVEPVLALGALVAIGYGLVGPAAAGRDRPGLGALLRRRRPARAADHLLERRGAAGRDRAAALRPPRRRSLAARRRCASPPPPRARRSAPGVYLSYSRGALAVTVARAGRAAGGRADLAAAARRGHRRWSPARPRRRARPRSPAWPR